MMWHGGVSVPDGWWVCDGTHGTPNLRGRFIAASDNTADYSPGAHKDLNVKEVKLSVDNLPPHTHTYYSAGTFQAHGTGSNRSCPGDGQTSNGNFRNLPFDIRPSYYALIFIMKL